MSTYANFKLSKKEKDDFYGILLSTDSKTIFKTLTRVSGNDSVFEFSLSTAFNTTTATFTDSFSLNQSNELAYNSSNYSTAANISVSGIKFNTDGTKFYVCDSANSRINQYNCTTAYDVSTASYFTTFSTYAKEITPRDLIFNSAGTTMIVLGAGGNYDQGISAPQLVQYTLSTAFNISTATFSKRASLTSSYPDVKGLISNVAGTVFYVSDDTNNLTSAYTISTAFDLASVVALASYDHTSTASTIRGIALNAAGTKLYALNNATNLVYEYPLNTAFNIVSTQPSTANFSIRTNNINPRGITFNPAGTKMFITGDAGIFQIDGGDDETPYTHLARTRNAIRMYEGFTYVFDVSSSTLLNHNLSFSTTSNGTHAGGSAYTTGVTSSGTIGNSGATVTIVIPKNPDSITPGSAVANLFYFDNKHSKLGGSISTPEYKEILKVISTNFVDNILTRQQSKLQEDVFQASYLLSANTQFSVVNGDLVINIV